MIASLQVEAVAVHADPLRACQPQRHPEKLHGKLVVVQRGDCNFVQKARHVQAAGAAGGIVVGKSRMLGDMSIRIMEIHNRLFVLLGCLGIELMTLPGEKVKLGTDVL